MKKVIASAGLLALGAAGVHDARADWAAGPDKPWSISGTLRGFYDSNINTAPDHTGAHQSSFGFQLSPSAHISLADGPTTFTASYTYGANYYENRTPNKWDQSHDFELFMNHNFNERYSLDVEESFLDSQEPEVLAPTGGAPLRANGDNYRNVSGFHFSDQITPVFSMVAGYSLTWYDYTGTLPETQAGSPPYSDLLNRLEHLITINARYQVLDETTLVLGYNFGAVGYTEGGSINDAGGVYVSPATKNNYTHYIYVGADQTFRSDLTASVRAGVQVADYYNIDKNPLPGSDPSSVTPYASLNVAYTYMDGGVFNLGFSHAKNQSDVGFDPTTGLLSPDQETSTLFGSIVQTLTPLSPDLTATLSAQYQNSQYNGGGFSGDEDDFYSLGINFTYQFTHYISAEVGYNYDELLSDISARSYNRDRVYIGVTATY